LLRAGLIFVGILLLVYGLYVLYFYNVQRHALFPRHLLPPARHTIVDFPGWQQRWIEVTNPMPDVRVESWYLPSAAAEEQKPVPVIIIAHGNGELIDIWPPRVAALQQQGWGVLLVEYPGYGRSTGEPSEAAIGATLVAAYDWVIEQPGVDPERIILFGYSVGGGAIGTLARQRPSAALVLMSTFTSMRAMAGRFFLPGILARDPFDNLATVQAYPKPLLLIHGSRDTTIPAANSVALQQAATGSKLLLLPCGHADCVADWDDFWPLVVDFLASHGVLE
jgi:pimeloyl-ACP methyl ester carboxylesterase